jgi:pimeloyl-ACP methyl ester carboxylesterase
MGATTTLLRRALITAAASVALSAPAASAAPPGHYTGSTSDGGSWVADLPAGWNGTLLLYSHGYGTTQASDAPDPDTQAALLARGYALAGSGLGSPSGSLWVLGTALDDQFETLDDVTRTILPHAPEHVLAVGTSMGGLVSSLEAERGHGRLDGVLSTCGIVGGGVNLSNYQLDGEYVMRRLLAPDASIKLVDYADAGEAAAAAAQLQAVGEQAQTTPAGRARLALAMAFLNTTPWSPTAAAPPDPDDPAAVEAGQYATEFGFAGFPIIPFTVTGRQQIELSQGGNASWTKGVDFAHELSRSPYRSTVEALYQQAGLDLGADLRNLTRDADITPDPRALLWALRYSVPTGRLEVPTLTLHTIGDNLVPVTHEDQYAKQVARAGASALLRQAYVGRAIHCNFTPAELVAGVLAVQQRVESGSWGTLATPAALNASAAALGLGGSAFVDYQPGAMIGQNLPPWLWWLT